MNSNIRRHQLLKILTERYQKGFQPGEKIIGVSWDELKTKMECTLDKLLEISAPLYEEKEVEDYVAYGIKGLLITTRGISSSTTEFELKLIFCN